MKARVVLTMIVVMTVSMWAQADMLYLRDGWDPVNNAADAGGYTGTRDDTGVYNAYGATEWTGSDKLIASRTNFSASVIGFDISGYAGDIATLNSATLVMTFSAAPWWGNSVTWAIRNPDKQWVEDEAYYYKASNAASLWNNWDPDKGMRMTTPNITTTSVAAGPNTSAGRTGETVSFDVTSLVQTWIDDAADNWGVAVVSTNSASNTAYWAGKAYSTVEYRPMLVLDYVPEPLTMVLMGVGAMGLLRRRK